MGWAGSDSFAASAPADDAVPGRGSDAAAASRFRSRVTAGDLNGLRSVSFALSIRRRLAAGVNIFFAFFTVCEMLRRGERGFFFSRSGVLQRFIAWSCRRFTCGVLGKVRCCRRPSVRWSCMPLRYWATSMSLQPNYCVSAVSRAI